MASRLRFAHIDALHHATRVILAGQPCEYRRCLNVDAFHSSRARPSRYEKVPFFMRRNEETHFFFFTAGSLSLPFLAPPTGATCPRGKRYPSPARAEGLAPLPPPYRTDAPVVAGAERPVPPVMRLCHPALPVPEAIPYVFTLQMDSDIPSLPRDCPSARWMARDMRDNGLPRLSPPKKTFVRCAAHESELQPR